MNVFSPQLPAIQTNFSSAGSADETFRVPTGAFSPDERLGSKLKRARLIPMQNQTISQYLIDK